MSFPIETLRAAESLFTTVLRLIQEEMKRTQSETPPSLLEILQGANPAASAPKRKSYPYGFRTEIPLEEIHARGIIPTRLAGPWPSKGDTFFRIDRKAKIIKGFMWNSTKPFPDSDRKNIFRTADEAKAAKRTKVMTPKALKALANARAAKAAKAKTKKAK